MDKRWQIVAEAARDILNDPEWTMRVVCAAIVAQDHLERNSPAFEVLWEATKQRWHAE